jgi:hypothetical protein
VELEQLNDDQQSCGAEMAVIVTAAMPKDVREPFVREADVWVSRFDAARPLARALRSILRYRRSAPFMPLSTGAISSMGRRS